ncbi:spermidine/putrescine ABC transporter permease [Spiroplasma culicicola]|uniref:Spermidine/putrescine ABC transporter permease n=1 Tax=Spiroplasma culicicola AES-1 TaxID=1276246 RepID=W6A6B1_9MOLU|nr:spermidine/putrescine ABC transporter permease [Spiroplasma culicicola]AHI52491.1 spermidine/putrescine ABC transporter permease [Spiroplasma culicicola AES-1]
MNNNIENNEVVEIKDNFDIENELEAIEDIESIGSEEEFVYKTASFKEKIGNFKIVKSLKGKIWPVLLPFMVTMGFLVILPLVGIILFAIINPTGNSIKFELNLENFVRFFTSSSIMIVLGLSLLYAVIASIIAVTMAYPIALVMSQLKSKLMAKNVWVLLTLPIWISMILKILGLRSLFELLGGSALGTPFAVIVGMVYMFLPFAISPIYNALDNQDPSYYQAALDLKASKSKAFWHITFRQSLPGVFAGFTLVLVQAATSLLIVRYMGDGKINLITTIIENYFFKGTDFGFGATVAVVLALLLFLIMGITKLLSNKFEVRGSRKWKNSSNPAIS